MGDGAHQSACRHRIQGDRRRAGARAAGDPANPANFTFPTGAYPNQLNNVAIKGGFVFLPNTGASPNGPVRFDVNTQSLLAVINRTTHLDAGRTINMHLAVKNQTNATSCSSRSRGRWHSRTARTKATSSAPPATRGEGGGGPDHGRAQRAKRSRRSDARAADPGRQESARHRHQSGRHARVRDELRVARRHRDRPHRALQERVTATLQSASLPAPGSQADKIHIGKELYNTSVGEFDPSAGHHGPDRRPHVEQRLGLVHCLPTPFGLSDNVVWIFPPGPRRTIPQHADFDPDRSPRVTCSGRSTGRPNATRKRTSSSTSAPSPAVWD